MEDKQIKYKPCCDRRCMVRGCKIKESGGCYCLCRMFDAIDSIEKAKDRIEEIRAKIKEYEVV